VVRLGRMFELLGHLAAASPGHVRELSSLQEQHPQQLWNYNEENALSDQVGPLLDACLSNGVRLLATHGCAARQKYWDNWASFHTHICSTSHLGTIHCHWGYASSLAGNDFWGESMHLCNGVDETGCNGPDGHVWGAVKKYVEYPTVKHHSTRCCYSHP
jgi:hypothetical protein